MWNSSFFKKQRALSTLYLFFLIFSSTTSSYAKETPSKNNDATVEKCGTPDVIVQPDIAAIQEKIDNAATTEKSRKRNNADWTIVTYIQADNNLSSFAYHNIHQMQQANTSGKVNILIQWDQPNNNKTWRYKIEKGKRVEAGSLDKEMGIDPEREIVEAMQWAKDKFPADHYMLVLWNHGNGVLDRSRNIITMPQPWLEIPGMNLLHEYEDRGILYDDSQGTYLSNRALSNALKKIKNDVLGKKIDIIGMDACLMAMVEVAYQIEDYARYLVASEHLEPGDGWSYAGFLNPLVKASSPFSPSLLAKSIVNAYEDYYEYYSDYTQSAIDLSKVESVVKGVDNVVAEIENCSKIQEKRTAQMVEYARNKAIKFHTKYYLDLYSYYAGLRKKARRQKSFNEVDDPDSKNSNTISNEQKEISRGRYRSALSKLEDILSKEMNNIRRAVIANVTGSKFNGAKGISIYYPQSGINSTYFDTFFAQQTNWLDFVKKF